jgi:putative membrane protein insertion efficiency factor
MEPKDLPFKEKPRRVVVFLLKIYQRTLSLDHGPFKWMRPHGQCKFYPTCSQYAIDVVQKHGIFRGGWRALKRIIRCHPWAIGGVDEPPV